jgi:hypothetical protein
MHASHAKLPMFRLHNALSRIIGSDDRVFSINYLDRGQAVVLASRLYRAVHDPDITAEISKYHLIRKTREENKGLFEVETPTTSDSACRFLSL